MPVAFLYAWVCASRLNVKVKDKGLYESDGAVPVLEVGVWSTICLNTADELPRPLASTAKIFVEFSALVNW